MIGASALAGAALAGAAYTLTPGPGFLALLGIGAAQGRGAGARFLLGHFAGDLIWASLALAALVGARQIGAVVFDVLGMVCGLYLGRLGWRAVSTRRRGAGAELPRVGRPLLRGIAFGLTNPKAYPVALATFTALLGGEAGLDWRSLPKLLAAAACGFILADMVLVLLGGAASVRRFYGRHELAIVRASGVLFLGFAFAALHAGVTGLLASRT
jgi:threonine/homoserine/homoserine lactone efflux protein